MFVREDLIWLLTKNTAEVRRKLPVISLLVDLAGALLNVTSLATPRGLIQPCVPVDINECKLNSRLCTFVCKNFIGGYRCQCPPGFRGDGRTCNGM